MTKQEKLLKKFLENPESLNIKDIIKIFEYEWFIRTWGV